MSKELKIVISFFLISFLLVSIFGFLNWYNKKDEIGNLDHIGHPNWSRPLKLVSGVYNYDFSVISEEDYFTYLYLTRNQKNKYETLYLNKFNFEGKKLKKKKLLSKKSLNDFEVFKSKDLIHIFAIIGEDDSNQKLKYFQLNRNFNIINKLILKRGLDYAYGLELEKNNKNIFLAYTTMINNNYKIELLKYNSNKKKILAEKLLNNYQDARLPEIKINNDRVYLSFLKLNQQKNYQIGSASRVNEYNLFLEKYSLNLENKIRAKELDAAFLKDERSQPKIKFANNDKELIVFYHKFQDLKKEVLLNKLRYNINENKVLSKRELGRKIVNIDTLNVNNENKIVYASQNKRKSILFLSKYNDLNKLDLDSKRLFTKMYFSYNPRFLKAKDATHLSWIEMENGKNNIYYANTLSPKKPGFFEIIGLEFQDNKMNYITAPLYFISMPILSIFRNLYILAVPVIILALLYYLNNILDNNILKIINRNIYISFTVGVISIILFIQIFLEFNILFYPGSPPENLVILTLAAAFIGVLFILRFFRTNSSQAILIGSAGLALWIYWCSQISMLFHAYKYFY